MLKKSVLLSLGELLAGLGLVLALTFLVIAILAKFIVVFTIDQLASIFNALFGPS